MKTSDTKTAPRFGTMGWAYDDWRGPFYSRDVRPDKLLEQYASVFSAVELDTTFYGAPRLSTLTQWAASTPATFRFCAKVPRAITHERRLVHASEALRDFADLIARGLGDKLGSLLLQLPPDFSETDRSVLETFLQDAQSPRRGKPLPLVVEFRHSSWNNTDIATTLTDLQTFIAMTDRSDLSPLLHYVRLLGTENSVARFDTRQFDRSADLDVWAEKLRHADTGPFVFVRNFYEGHAPATIFSLMERLKLPAPQPPGKQQTALDFGF